MMNEHIAVEERIPMIELHGVSRDYGKFHAVQNIDLSVYRGEIFGFLGVNGAGKTTTLRMVTGILQPTSGSILVGGHDLLKNPREAKRITGYIPDRPYLYAKLTAREFLEFIGDLYEVPSDTRDAGIQRLLREYSLTEWENELIDSFSHGMKQRLATAAALLHSPKVLVIDEPMVGLDPHGAQLLKASLKQHAAAGMTIFLSTHSLHVAEELSHRVAIIDRGRIIAIGTVQELKTHAGREQSNLEDVFLQLTQSIYVDGSQELDTAGR